MDFVTDNSNSYAIKKIKEIKNYPSFYDYKDNKNVAEFKKFNIFFGSNGSGKTSLSRIFRDYFLPQEGIKNEKKIYMEIATGKDFESKKVHVFNIDYIKNNFKWEEEKAQAKSFMILGEENIKIDEGLKELNRKLGEIKKRLYEKNKEIGTFLTNKAAIIKTKLKLNDHGSNGFNKIHLEKQIEELIKEESSQLDKAKEEDYKKELLPYILEEEKKKDEEEKAIATDKGRKIEKEINTYILPKIDELRKLLEEEISAAEKISADDPAIFSRAKK